MFCPQCGAETASDRVRFCTHCRFPVGAMKEFITTETSKNDAEEEKKFYPLRQRDINLGAGLMLIGVLKASLVSLIPIGLKSPDIFFFLFALGLVFSVAIIFSQLSPRQRGLTLGATFIFLGSLLGLVAGLPGVAFGAIPGMFLAVSLALVVSLLWTRLAGMFMRIFFDKEILPEKKVSPHSVNLVGTFAPSLPAENAPDVEPITNRMKEPEMASPISVTENTTKTLKLS